MSEEMPEFMIERDIAKWHERELSEGDPVPDFWDKCDTSFRLGRYLASLGYFRVRRKDE